MLVNNEQDFGCIVGCHEGYKYCTLEQKMLLSTVFAIWNLEYCNNWSCSKGWEWYTQANNHWWVVQFTWQGKGTMAFALYCAVNFPIYRCSKFKYCTPCMCLHLPIMGCHKDAFDIWSLEYCNNESCYKGPQIVLSLSVHVHDKEQCPLLCATHQLDKAWDWSSHTETEYFLQCTNNKQGIFGKIIFLLDDLKELHHSHLLWLVFEGSIPTFICFHSENFLWQVFMPCWNFDYTRLL